RGFGGGAPPEVDHEEHEGEGIDRGRRVDRDERPRGEDVGGHAPILRSRSSRCRRAISATAAGSAASSPRASPAYSTRDPAPAECTLIHIRRRGMKRLVSSPATARTVNSSTQPRAGSWWMS